MTAQERTATELTRLPSDVELAALQASLPPGGRVALRLGSRRAARRAAARIQHYFEGPAPGKRYPPVRARREGKAWLVEAVRRSPAAGAGHFEDLAPEYARQMPDHVVQAFEQRKLARIEAAARRMSTPQRDGALRVLDLGCGIGAHARALAARVPGVRITAMDASPQSVRVAREQTPVVQARAEATIAYAAGSATALPFGDASFDLAYTVNCLHHLKRGEQEQALRELRRVLRPGGRLLVFEINTRNPLFRFYMRQVFPRLRPIDRGDEEFIPDARLPLGVDFRVDSIEHYSFLPDFLPAFLLRPMRALERGLERTRAAKWGIHYTATLEVPR